jgi:predicted transcriptional regulator of viral defense system
MEANMREDDNKAKLFKKALIRSADARAAGIHPAMLSYYEKKGILERIGRGLYRNKQVEMDVTFEWEDLVHTVLSIPHGVVTGISALALYDLTEEIPRQHWIAVPNETSIGKRPNVKIVRLRNHELGISQIKIGDAEVPIYDLERTLVDAFRLLTVEAAIKALKEAFKPQRKQKPDLKKLAEYAKRLRVKMEPYLLMVTT